MKTDFLVIGSGIAGLTYAIKAARKYPEKKVTVITKTSAEETNTKYAQGGIAGVWNDSDSFEKHIEDTMIAGDGLSNPRIVEIVVHEGVERIKEIISYGADFDKDDSGNYSLGREGAIVNLEFYITKMLQAMKLKEPCWPKLQSIKIFN